ncbi:MBL fold metallo-hydrolase [Euzebya tangerina]|uniref:MBL fold metallo-hydrolase n=1 Tax=Euzebya tangerina TaxID=591198 RepID=UPI000E31A634|nr:MBL fold metallo-hydrolase [Euzebya tangerina]
MTESADGAVQLDELTRIILAPNPSPMTLEGTNTYLLADPAHDGVVIVDPGPDDDGHRQQIESALGGADVAAVIITHHHIDHAEAAGWATEWSAPLRAFDPGLIPDAVPFVDGEQITLGGLTVTALHTPGHASDHLCLRMDPTDVVLTGDHVLGRGTTVVNWPDGDMTAYMASLERLAQAPGRRIYPGHGPTVTEPQAKVREYIAHRKDRERQVLAAIADGADSADAIVEVVYADVPEFLHPAARKSVQALLEMLVGQGRAPSTLSPAP